MGTPFKMTGHTLPGPNQAAPVKQFGLIGKGIKLVTKYGKKAINLIKGNKSAKKKIAINEPTYYNTRTGGWQSHPGLSSKKNYNPFTDPNKAKKTMMSDIMMGRTMRTDYSNKFIKAGKLNIKN